MGLAWDGIVEWSATTPHGLFIEIWIDRCDEAQVHAVSERHRGLGNPVERATFYNEGDALAYARAQRERWPWPLTWHEYRPNGA
jgi:hypothetical protein